jgi:hypothetical protein
MTDGSAARGIWTLLKVSLAAIPLLFEFQGAILGQMHAAMGATDHRGCIPFGRRPLGGGLSLEFAPAPYRCGNQGNPEQ